MLVPSSFDSSKCHRGQRWEASPEILVSAGVDPCIGANVPRIRALSGPFEKAPNHRSATGPSAMFQPSLEIFQDFELLFRRSPLRLRERPGSSASSPRTDCD